MILAEKVLLLAAVGQVSLTLVVLYILGRRRLSLIAAKKINVADIATGEEAWPLAAKLAHNNFANQFQLPVLFYALVALVIASGLATPWMAALAALFVVSRILHTFIHITSNQVRRRFACYVVGMAILGLMWLGFAIQIIQA